jgi:integrase
MLATSLTTKSKKHIDKKLPYRLPTLNERKGDLSKRWYIEYYVTHQVTKKLVRQVRYCPTEYKTKDARRQWAKPLLTQINELFKTGIYILKPKQQIDEPVLKIVEAPLTVREALKQIVELYRNSHRKRTYESYLNALRRFNDFLIYSGYSHLLLTDFSRKHVYEFSDYIIGEVKGSNRYRNNLVHELRSLFNALIKRGHITVNPTADVEDLPHVVTRRNIAYTKEQQAVLEDYLKVNDQPMYRFTRFIYQAFIRPLELTQLQVRDIELENNRIAMHGSITKSVRKEVKMEYIQITAPLLEVIESMNLSRYKPTDYVFGKKLMPGPKKMIRNNISARHQKALKKTGLYNGEVTLYSWKHCGVVNGYKAGAPIEWLQQQLRHTSLEQTCIYLKSLGLMLHQRLDIPVW